MRSNNCWTIEAKAFLALVMVFGFSTQNGFSRAIDQSSFSKIEQNRLDSITHDWEQCDKISAEGYRLECTKKALACFESEILRVNAEVRKSLPVAQRNEFDKLCRAWNRYFDAEKKHWFEMSQHVGTVMWIGSHNSLVQIAKNRAEFVLAQLP